MKTDVFCPKCNKFITKVDCDSSGYKTETKICPNCKKGVIIEYGNGRLDINA